jgi:hypothetical protein
MRIGILEHERGQACPLCGAVLVRGYVGPRAGDAYELECETCGNYRISSTLEEQLANPASAEGMQLLLPYLRAHVRQSTDRGSPVDLTTDNWEYLARAHMHTPVPSIVPKVLELIAARSRPGEYVKLDELRTAARLDLSDPRQLPFLVEHLLDRKLIHLRKASSGPKSSLRAESECRLTVEGWNVASPVAAAGRSGVVFVAMYFDRTMDPAYDAISQSIESDCGLHALRVDREEHNDQITDRIMAGIRTAQFIVADVTGQRQGVYFEAGFAMGLGRPVIWCCHESEIGKVHFDTRQFSHVVWSSPADLRTRLTDRIRGTILTPVKLD